jgi:hypothetical protein
LTTLNRNCIEFQILYYGQEEGTKRYRIINEKKTKHLIHDSEIQKERSIKATKRKKELGNCYRQTTQYWIDRHGYSVEEAANKIHEIQKTFSKEVCIQKHGNDLGIALWEERQNKWQKSLTANPDNYDLGFKRSHSLKRYIQRANDDESIGLKSYIKYRQNLSGFKKASKESMKLFSPIASYLDQKNICYYCGFGGGKEWFVVKNKKTYFYDFAIPKLKLIIEYNGETWHPNPLWEASVWQDWMHPHTQKKPQMKGINLI